MSHFQLVKLLEALAASHLHGGVDGSGPGCDSVGCRYCEAMVDVASVVSADWVLSLTRSREANGCDPRELQPLPIRAVIRDVMERLGEEVAHG